MTKALLFGSLLVDIVVVAALGCSDAGEADGAFDPEEAASVENDARGGKGRGKKDAGGGGEGVLEAGTSAGDASSSGGDTGTTPKPECTTTKVWQNLEACGWPGPSNTGYPAGTTFVKTVSGGLTITVDGTVIDAQRISGGVRVKAKNVVIKNSWITQSAGGASGSGVVNVTPGASVTIERTTLDGQNATHACIWHEGSAMTAKQNDCFGVNDGIFSWATTEGVAGTGDNFLVEGNWLHDFTIQAANGHIDGYQTEGAKDGVIRHNTIDVAQSQNATVAIWNSRRSSDNILIDDNLMAGSGFAVYAEDYSPSELSPAGGYSVTNIRITNNKFSTVHYGCVGYWGVWYPRGKPTDGWNRSGNVVLETGQNIDAQNPSYNGAPCN